MGIKSNNPSESYFNFFGQSGKDAVGQAGQGGPGIVLVAYPE